MDNLLLKRIKSLITALAISGTLNIGLTAFIVYWMLNEAPPKPYCEHKPAINESQGIFVLDHTNSRAIRYLRTLSFDQLLQRLSSSQLIENGYCERDLALACLVAFHDFDLHRALPGSPALQQRTLVYGRNIKGQPVKITAFSGLSDKQFETIINFCKAERWPKTPKGLFVQLQKQYSLGGIYPAYDEFAIDAFALTSEYIAIEKLFQRADVHLDRDSLLQLILEGDWELLSSFHDQQRASQDLSKERRQRLLVEYLDKGSKSAAFFLLKVEPHFAVKKLDDEHILKMLKLLDQKCSETEKFALSLLINPRSDAVWKQAAARLYNFAGEDCPDKCSPQAVLLRFAPQTTKKLLGNHSVKASQTMQRESPSPLAVTTLPPAPIQPPMFVPKAKTSDVKAPIKKERLYTVQEGDNLWKIARRFNIDINSLRKHNKLTSDTLKPGAAIRIPG